MNISPTGINLIETSEGFVDHAYPDSTGFSIGFGTFLNTPELLAKYNNITITRGQFELLMMNRVHQIEQDIEKLVKVPLTQNQFDAIADFIYNEGTTKFNGSTLLKLLNQQDYQGAANQFLTWDISNGKILPGLLARRNRERTLFLL
jgi:lysozyme